MGVIFFLSTLIHLPELPGIGLARVTTDELDAKSEDDFDLILELAGELLVKEEDDAGTTKGKWGNEALDHAA